MKSNVYIISVLVALTIHTATQSMEAPGEEKKTYATKRKSSANDDALLQASRRRSANGTLLVASRKGNIAKILSLLEKGSNIDTIGENGMQPIHLAAENGHTATVELLLDRGATGIDARDRFSCRPIHCAAQSGHTATVELLLDRGAKSIDAQNRVGNQPIYLAAFNAHTATVELLLDRGSIGIDAHDMGGCQPIHSAAANGHTAMVELLLDRGATGIDAPDNKGRQPIHLAAYNGHTATVKLLLDRGATGMDAPDNNGWQLLPMAVRRGDTATVELLLDRGATGIDSPANFGNQPLHYTALLGHTATIIILISHGATIPDTRFLHRTLAEVFAQSDFTSIPPITFNTGYRKTITLSDVFSMAAGQNKQETVQTILRLHRTNLTDGNIIDALIGSATAGHDALVRMLHNQMSNDRNLRSLVPETLALALSRAVAHCRLDVIRYIIEQDSTYDTPTFSLLRPAGTLPRRMLSPYAPSEIRASKRLSD